MYLNKINVKTKCDNGACRNYADYEVVRADTMVANRLRLCESCLKKIGELASLLESDTKRSKNNDKKTKKEI
ncbi:MAG: hypothetical protein J6V69_02155 [Clostridia bacterium]|nr:hypothetical protein [Clostridia bacterium]